MAATVASQTIHNGARNLVVKSFVSGTTGDITDTVIVDVSAIDSGIGVNGLTLTEIDWNVTGFTAALEWDATTDVGLIQLDGEGHQDFRAVGGIKNNAGSGATGDVLITTTGYTASGDGGHIVMKFRKT